MQKIKWPIIIVSAYLIFYQSAGFLDFSVNIIIAVYILSSVLLLWMVYKILKDGVPSGRKFDEYFYDDWDYRRKEIE
jgi:Co/Zn/Cd efflux system component